MKNEASCVAEWIAFQRAIGFDKVLAYDNGSTDATADIVRRIARADRAVIYTWWPDVPGQAPQLAAYRHAVAHCDTDWLAFFDVDEFLVLHRQPTIAAFLAAVPAGISAIACNWKMFGSSGQLAASTDLVIRRFRRCATVRHPKNRFCKTIVRRDAVKTIRVHTVDLAHGVYGDSLFRPVAFQNDAKTRSVCHGGAQLNHYLLKSWEEFEQKRRRGNAARAPEAPDKYAHRGNATRPPQSRWHMNPGNEYWLTHDLNMRTDTTALCWVPQVLDRLAQWGLVGALEHGTQAETPMTWRGALRARLASWRPFG